VNFEIAGDITEITQITFTQWPNVGETIHTVSVYPIGAARTITGPALSGSNGVITLLGSDNFVLDGRVGKTGTANGLTIVNNADLAQTMCVVIASNTANPLTSNVTIRNTNFKGFAKTTNNSIGVYVGGEAEDLEIFNNNFNSSYWGLYIIGASAANNVSDINVYNNVFGSTIEADQIGYAGAYFGNVDNANFYKNEIFNINQTGSFDAVTIGAGAANSMFELNKIHGLVNSSTNRASAFGINASANANLTFANNLIWDVNNNGTGGATFPASGFYFAGGTNYKLYHNTVLLTGDRSAVTATPSSVSAPSGCVVVNSTAVTALDIQNNIFINNLTMSNTSSTAKNYAIYTSGLASSFTNINSNLYYANGTASFLGYLSSDMPDLSSWQIATSQDANSKSKAITFKGANDLHLDGVSALDNDLLCNPIAAVTKDMDDANRRTGTGQAQMGADEVRPVIAYTQNLVNDNVFYCVQIPAVELPLQVAAAVTGFQDGITRTIVNPQFTYKWYFNGTLIDGANAALYTLLIDSENRLGNIYQAEATCMFTSMNSVAKTIKAEQSMQITANPIPSQLLCTDRGFIDISANAIGTIDSYGWEKFNPSNGTWNVLAGKIGTTLRVELNDAAMGAGSYRMIVRGPGNCGVSNVYSQASVITTVEPVSNVVIGANEPVIDGDVKFCVEENIFLQADVPHIVGLVTGYMWQKKIDNVWSDLDLNLYPTANTPRFELFNAKQENSGQYRLVVSGSDVCDITSTVSNELNVTVFPFVKVLNHPKEQIVCRGEQVMLSVKAEGNNQIFQWQKDGKNITIEENATANKAVFVIPAADFAHNGNYRCVIALDGCISGDDGGADGRLYTKTALVYVMTETRIVEQPQPAYTKLTGNAVFEVKAHASGAPVEYMAAYQWYKGEQPLTDNARISGSQSSMLVVKNVNTSDLNADYWVKVTGLCGSVNSDRVQIYNPTFTFASQPQAQVKCLGEEAVFAATVTTTVENASFTYEWHFVSATGTDLVLPDNTNEIKVPALEANAGSYYVKVTMMPGGSSAHSAAVSLTVNELAKFTEEAQDAAITAGGNFTLTCTAVSGTPETYQWYRNGVAIANERNASITTTEANAGVYTYKLAVINSCGQVMSRDIKVTVTAGGSLSVIDELGVAISEVSPNPVSNAANFTINSSSLRNIEVKLLDAGGREISNLFNGLVMGSQEIKLSSDNLSSGVYFVNITIDGKTITRQIAVVK